MPQKRYAYLIGANGPQQRPPVVDLLKYAERDIEHLKTALSTSPCAFTEVNTIVANTPTPVIEGLELLAQKCEPSDLLVVHFSGHGRLERQLYLICNKTDVERKLFTSGAIKIDLIKDILRDCPARHKLLILDCCHAAAANAGGTWTKGISDLENALGELKGNANIILSACASNKTTRELSTLEIGNERGAGFLSWAITRACSQDFTQAARDQALSLDDIWRWMTKEQEKINRTLPSDEQIPLPRWFGEREGQDCEIWFTSHRRKTTGEDTHNEQRQREELAIHEQEDFLRQYCYGVNVEDFDRTKVLEYAQKQHDYEKLPTNHISILCQHLGLASGTGMPRREAVLAFHTLPSRYLASAFIRVFARNYTSKEYISGDIEGSLSEQAEKTLAWLLNRLEKIAENIGAKRRSERYEIPERALRELVVNAIVHRDYKANECIHVKITPKEITITNPGQLDPAIIACDPPFSYGESHPHNARLLRILATQNWAEGNALGFEIVREEFEAHGLPLPTIENLPGGLVKVIIQRPDLSAISRNNEIVGNDPHIWNVPYPRNYCFTAREETLNDIYTTFINKITVQVLCGLGGIGKTEIAIEYAYRQYNHYYVVLWARADAQETLFTDFVRFADLLQLPGKQKQDQKHTVNAVKYWLATHTGWLLILDNVEDLNVACDYFPPDPRGHVLMTTRMQVADGVASRVEIEKMEPEDGARLLLQRAHFIQPNETLATIPQVDSTNAIAISKLLDGLPLALDQAGAYIEETRTSLPGYIDLYAKRRAQLLNKRGRFELSHPEPVSTTWSLTFESIEQANPAAADLLRLFAFLHPDAIPEELIYLPIFHLRPLLQTLANDLYELNEAIAELRKYSLVRRNPDGTTFSLHRLVQVILRDTMNERAQQEWSELVVRAINEAFPSVEFSVWQACQRYLPHAQYCFDLIKQWKMTFPEATRLLNEAGQFLVENGQYTEAAPFLEYALSIREQVRGPAHLEVAESLNNLAEFYRHQGKYYGIEALHQHALDIREQLLGPMHPDVASSLNNLGMLYHEQGQYDTAKSLHERALAIREQVLGPIHPDTAISLNNLAGLFEQQHRYQDAEPLYKRALAIREQVLGPEHPDTAISLNNLAGLYRQQGHYQDAEPLYKRTLAIREQILGSRHPDTGVSFNNLANLYHYQGKHQEAKSLYQQALTISEQTLGTEHLYTETILKNYTILLQQIDRKVESTDLQKEIQEKNSGTP